MRTGWIDFSQNERNKLMQTLKLLETPGVLDELGIGVIRDGYADILFPGLSTIQRRAKYFVLLPFIFNMAEKIKFDHAADVMPWIHKQEDMFVSTLTKNSKDKSGIIGYRTHQRGNSVKIKPSAIYWNGMKTFEILRDERLSISNVCNIIYSKQKRKKTVAIRTETKRNEGDGYDDDTAVNENLAVFSWSNTNNMNAKDMAMELTVDEAEYLYEKITTAKKSAASLLAFMLKKKCLFPSFNEIDDTILPDGLKKNYRLAKRFSEFIYGAHLYYNVIFFDDSNGADTTICEEYREWRAGFDFNGFDLQATLSNVKSDSCTNAFVNKFFEASKNDDPDTLKSIITQREKSIKRERAKLGKPHEYKYDNTKLIHHYKLNYRYKTAYTIINDILNGLEGINANNNGKDGTVARRTPTLFENAIND